MIAGVIITIVWTSAPPTWLLTEAEDQGQKVTSHSDYCGAHSVPWKQPEVGEGTKAGQPGTDTGYEIAASFSKSSQ